jgi:hypothetical protein
MEWAPANIVTVLTKEEMHAHWTLWFTSRWVSLCNGEMTAYAFIR